jgi:hypothetical protein
VAVRRLTAVLLALAAGCGSPSAPAAVSSPDPSPARTTTPPTPGPTHQPVVVRFRVERRVSDPATAGFARTVLATLSDPRGWQRGDVRLVPDEKASYVVVLVEPDEAQRLCQPYDVYRKYSCQNGPTVVLNAERWRHATPQWTGSLAAYRQMLVNHEVGHLLGLHHPVGRQCPRPGVPARVMAQQSTELRGCLPNPWPLPEEIARLARHDLPLAPPPD